MNRLFKPLDISSIVVLRISFAAILLYDAVLFLHASIVAPHKIVNSFQFTYYGFHWVQPLPPLGITLLLSLLTVLTLFIMIGFLYRLSMILFFLGFTYFFLLDQTFYLNHFYFVSLMSFLLIFTPAHNAFSMDALLRPSIRRYWVPTWSLWLLRTQVAIVYIYAAIAKMNGDWLRGWPLNIWLLKRKHMPYLGSFFEQSWTPLFFSYAGLLLDLLIVPALFWKKTRTLGFLLIISFHLLNAYMFDIGIFPWSMIALTTLFLNPSWPRTILRKLKFPIPETTLPKAEKKSPSPKQKKIIIVLISVYLMLQLLIPFRHLLYPGNVHWTEEGHRFSWHMKLRNKVGSVQFVATDLKTKNAFSIELTDYLTYEQIAKMAGRPDMIIQFAHFLDKEFKSKGYKDLAIRAQSEVSLNGRRPQALVTFKTDLAKEKRNLLSADWIVPLREPLPKAWTPRQKKIARTFEA